MSNKLRVDLHNHTLWSKDCIIRFDTIIELCEKQNIDRIAITDHNTADGALELHQIAPELVIPGEEIMTTQGEILAYFVKETVPAGLSPKETIKRLRNQGAVISVSHPFDRFRKGAWQEDELDQIVELIDAIEVYNARCLFEGDNRKAKRYAEKHNKSGTAGSDSHTRPEYGTALTLMRSFKHDPEDFLDALSTASFEGKLSSWWVHTGSKRAKWMKKLGLRERLWEGG